MMFVIPRGDTGIMLWPAADGRSVVGPMLGWFLAGQASPDRISKRILMESRPPVDWRKWIDG